MESSTGELSAAELFARVVEATRVAVSDDEYDRAWKLVVRTARFGEVAATLAAARVTSPDPTARGVACDLLGVASELHETVREAAATTLLAVAADETDHDVQWSLARALGATCDSRALPVLVGLAGHADAAVRLRAAMSLPDVMPEATDNAGVDALLRLSRDSDPEVRNWATFGFGWQSAADSPAIREALWERTADSYPEAREEGIRGLARRRDPRALPLVAELLAEESAHIFTFDAAAYLGSPALLPLLENFDAADRGVAEALRECDPVRRARRDEFASALLDAVSALLPELEMAMYSRRFDLGITLEASGDRSRCWSVEAVMEAHGDPRRGAESIASRLRHCGPTGGATPPTGHGPPGPRPESGRTAG